MNIDLVIEQLKAAAPIFKGNVAGAARYAQCVADQVWLDRPAAYVIPIEDEPEPVQNMTGYQQDLKERIGIIVDIDNSADRRGQAAATQAVDVIRAALFKAIANWRTDESRQARGFSYASGGLIQDSLNRARLQWQFDFTIDTWIDQDDVWQPPSEPFLDIHATVTDQVTPADPLATFDVTLPQ